LSERRASGCRIRPRFEEGIAAVKQLWTAAFAAQLAEVVDLSTQLLRANEMVSATVAGLVEDISAATIRRILAAHQLKPWRHHLWLHPKQPRDAGFYATVSELIDLYTSPLRDDEMVLSLDEKTALQPRPRLAPTRPAHPQNLPNRYAHEYQCASGL